MKVLILICAILFQSPCSNQEQSKLAQAKNTLQVDKESNSLKLKFTKGVSAIFEDSKGNYWFGSQREGVCLFDGKKCTYFTINEGLIDNQIQSIQEDNNGMIWINTANGIHSFSMGKIKSYNVKTDVTPKATWGKSENDLWFNAGNNEGVFRYDGQALSYLALPNPKVINPDNVYFVTGIADGKNDMLWIATYAGVFGYDGSEFTIINDETLGLDIKTEPLHIRSILEDSEGRLWIGNNGIGVLLKDNKSIVNFSEKNNLIHPTSSRRGDKSKAGTLEHVFAIEEDGDGNIWFGDRDTGVWKYDGDTMKNYTKNVGLTNEFVLKIYKDNNDELWFILADGNVFKFNGESFDRQF